MTKQQKGLQWLLNDGALCERSDDGVPREAIRFSHLVKYSARILQMAMISGKRAESEDFGGGEWVVDLAGFDEMGVDLFQVSHSFA